MKTYAFISKDGILRIRNTENKAKAETANGKYLEVEIDYMDGGYPIWNFKEPEEKEDNFDGVIVYSETEMKVDAQKDKIKIIPELAELYLKLK